MSLEFEKQRRREVRPTDQPPEGATSADAKPVISFAPAKRGKDRKSVV